jgi:hypothetical protein
MPSTLTLGAWLLYSSTTIEPIEVSKRTFCAMMFVWMSLSEDLVVSQSLQDRVPEFVSIAVSCHKAQFTKV